MLSIIFRNQPILFDLATPKEKATIPPQINQNSLKPRMFVTLFLSQTKLLTGRIIIQTVHEKQMKPL